VDFQKHKNHLFSTSSIVDDRLPVQCKPIGYR